MEGRPFERGEEPANWEEFLHWECGAREYWRRIGRTINLRRHPRIELALRLTGAVHRRERVLGPAAAAFEAAVPRRIRGEERFQQALEGAETADSLQRALAWHEGEINEWATKAGALLSAIK